jgi:hypothetical protein
MANPHLATLVLGPAATLVHDNFNPAKVESVSTVAQPTMGRN